MKFKIEPPQELEVVDVQMQVRAIDATPVTLRGQHIVKAAYLTATGAGGAESKAVVLFNANTGEFTVQRRDGAPVQFDFDMPAGEFAKKRQGRSTAGKRGQQSRRANQQPQKEAVDATASD